ncbi:flagellin [Rhodospirillum sp. A1_3_36]|uniref:flagellin n=1 Tax=Rhodospirillum sp. A1_3_36 TaxID=3391666 RepID=UPI0039A6FACF
MAINSDRVGSYSQHSYLVSQLMTLNKRLTDTQTQVNTGKKSQTYSGIHSDAYRLVNMENQASRLAQFQKTNGIAKSRLEVMNASMEAMDTSMRSFKSSLSLFAQSTLTPPLDSSTLTKLNNIQDRAFAAMKDMEAFLNTDYDGRYLFAGGKTDTPPISLPFGNLKDFQDVYDGVNLRYPQSRTAALDDTKVTGTMDFAINPVVPPAAPTGTITDATGAFNASSATGTGITVTGQSITATVGTPYSNLSVGDLVRVEVGGSHAFATIETIDAGGAGLTFKAEPDLATAGIATNAGAWTVSVPAFSPGQVQVTDAGANFGTYKVTDISADGQTLTVEPPPSAAVAGVAGVTVQPQTYYKGDGLAYEHRMDDSRTIEVGVTGKDPAFEKAIRAMGIIAQGDLANNPQRVQEALTLIADAMEHSPDNTTEEASDLNTVAQTIGLNAKTLDATITQQENFQVFLENRISDTENVDKNEVLVRLSDESKVLETAYAAFSRISNLSLLNYL